MTSSKPPRATQVEMLMPTYAREFQCLGGDCPETCCAGWTITVDKDSFQTYRRVTQPELKPLFKEYLKQTDAKSYAVHGQLSLRKDTAQCGMQAPDGLCRIQTKLGEEALCDTCYTFPRHPMRIAGQYEQYMTLSCPAAAKLALTLPQAFEFVHAPQTIRLAPTMVVERVHGFTQEQVHAVRLFCVQLCQTDELTNTEKMVALGWLCRQLDALRGESLQHQTEDLLASMVAMVETGQLREQVRQLEPQADLSATLFAVLFGESIPANASAARRKVLMEVQQGLGLLDSTDPSLLDKYQTGIRILEGDGGLSKKLIARYLLNEVLREAFPWTHNSTLEHFQKLVTRYGIVRLMLAGIAACRQAPLDEDTIVSVIQVFARTHQHNTHFASRANQLMAEAKWTQLEHLYALLH